MERSHGIAGGLVVRTVDSSASLERSVIAEFGDGTPALVPAGRVTVRMLPRASSQGQPSGLPHRIELTGDAGDGRTVGLTDGGLVVSDRHGSVEVRGSTHDLDLLVTPGSAAWAVVRDLARPAIQVAGIGSGVVVAHAAVVAVRETAWLIAGWSESGKTEVALALSEGGATFIGDKWTVLSTSSDAGPDVPAGTAAGSTQVASFPVRVGVRDWVLPFLPTLARALGTRRRARLSGGAIAAAIGARTARIAAGRPITDAVLGPLAQTGGLAATIRLPAADIRRAFGQAPLSDRSLPLRGLVVLTSIDQGEVATIAPLEPAAAAARLARSATYERRGYHLLGERAAAHGRGPIPGFEIIEPETEAINRRIAGVPTFEVRAPFPADPRIAARLIREVL